MSNFCSLLIVCLLLVPAAMSFHAQSKSPNETVSEKPKASNKFVEGNTIVTEVKFTGLDLQDGNVYYDLSRIFEADLRWYLKDKKAALLELERLDRQAVSRALYLTKEFLADKGYLKANVAVIGESTGKDKMRLVFEIEKGPVIGVSDIRFTGLRNFEEEELRAEMQTCLGEKWGVYDMRHIDFCAQKYARSLLWSRGFFEARLSHPQRRYLTDSFELTIDVTEGIRYRIGEISVKGAKAFTEKEIREIIGQNTGDIADGRRLQDAIYNRLERVYKDLGYIHFNAEFDPEFAQPPIDGADATVNIRIVLDEGKQFTIQSINLAGVDKALAKKLLQDLSLKVNEVYSQTKLTKDIKKLNESGQFRWIDQDQHVELLADEIKGDLSISLRLAPLD